LDSTINDEIRAILSAVLKRPVGPDEKVVRREEPRWDSLKHIEIIFAVEDALNVQYDEDEVATLDSLAALVESVELHRAP